MAAAAPAARLDMPKRIAKLANPAGSGGAGGRAGLWCCGVVRVAAEWRWLRARASAAKAVERSLVQRSALRLVQGNKLHGFSRHSQPSWRFMMSSAACRRAASCAALQRAARARSSSLQQRTRIVWGGGLGRAPQRTAQQGAAEQRAAAGPALAQRRTMAECKARRSARPGAVLSGALSTSKESAGHQQTLPRPLTCAAAP